MKLPALLIPALFLPSPFLALAICYKLKVYLAKNYWTKLSFAKKLPDHGIGLKSNSSRFVAAESVSLQQTAVSFLKALQPGCCQASLG